jgi:DegV family protein with EDD domain
MKVKIVTDSTSDLPPDLAQELGITVVPAYVRFGDDIYRDRVDISEDEFYQRLSRDPVHPSTEPPTPQDFADAYRKLAMEADGIISIHISSRISATCNSARRGKEFVQEEIPIEVIDSQSVTMGLGLLSISATHAARSARSMQQVVQELKQNIPRIYLLGLLDTLKYLARGGRIGKAKALLGSMLNVKPLLTMRAGDVEPAGQVRTRESGIEALFDFTKETPDIQDLAVVYSTTPDEAQILAERIGSIVSKEHIRSARLGPVLGVHAGPGILFVALQAKA